MPHNSMFGTLSSSSPIHTSAGDTSPSSPPTKRIRDFATMSALDRPELIRPPSNSRSPYMLSPKSTLLRRRPAAPHQTSSTDNPLDLKLPEVALGRYHPLNFSSSQHSSVAGTPSSGFNSPQPAMSLRTHTRQLSEAERRLHEYYRDRAIASGRDGLSPSDKPTVPRLEAAISPGPVTPLELEGAASYFGAVDVSPSKLSPESRLDQLTCQGTARQSMSGRTPPIGSC